MQTKAWVTRGNTGVLFASKMVSCHLCLVGRSLECRWTPRMWLIFLSKSVMFSDIADTAGLVPLLVGLTEGLGDYHTLSLAMLIFQYQLLMGCLHSNGDPPVIITVTSPACKIVLVCPLQNIPLTWHRSSNGQQPHVVASHNIDLITDPTLLNDKMFPLAGKFFKRFDRATCSFISNIKEQFPDDWFYPKLGSCGVFHTQQSLLKQFCNNLHNPCIFHGVNSCTAGVREPLFDHGLQSYGVGYMYLQPPYEKRFFPWWSETHSFC